MELRPYQRESVDAIQSCWEEYRRCLLVLPTGCGKTICFSNVAKNQVDKGHRVLILAHREELLNQAADKLKSAVGLDASLEKAERSCLGSPEPVAIGSIQSMARENRLAKFPRDYFQTIIIDEAHHTMSPQYLRVLDHFNPVNPYVLGVTATPDRSDMKDLSKYYQKVAYRYELQRAVKEGYLCKPYAVRVPLKIDIRNVDSKAGDVDMGSASECLRPYLKQIAEKLKQLCANRKTVVFLPGISVSLELCDILNEIGVSAVEVNGQDRDRAQKLQDYENGKYSILCNAMLLTEGWDSPQTDCIVILRPTQIKSFYIQMAGRGMRLYPGKKNLLLLDFLWLTDRFDLMDAVCLVSEDDEHTKLIRKAMEEGRPIDLIDANNEADETIAAEKVASQKDIGASLAKALNRVNRGNKKEMVIDLLSYQIYTGDNRSINYKPTFRWEYDKPTQAQLDLLSGSHLDTSSVYSKGYASQVISSLQERKRGGMSTPEQMCYLSELGFVNVNTWTSEEAGIVAAKMVKLKGKIPKGLNPAEYIPERLR